jgi:raffinose/stachyose/melibiose transport system substrate-binding protein
MSESKRAAQLTAALAASVAVCLVLALAAGATPAKSGAVTLNLMYPTNYTLSFKIVTDNYKRIDPNVTFNQQSVSSTAYPTLIQTQLRAGNAADILFFNAGRGNAFGILNYSDAGYLVDLAGRPFEKRLIQPQLVGVKVGKKVWGTPEQIITVGMEYNKDMFKQFGVSVPKTFTQLLAACKTISSKGKIPIAFPAGDNVFPIFLVYGIIASEVYATDPTWNVKRQQGKVSFATSPGWRRTYTKILQMKDSSCFSPGAVSTIGAAAQAQFVNGDAAMYVSGTQNFGAVRAAKPSLNFGLIPVPTDKAANQRVMLSSSAIFGVNAATTGETRAAALKFMDFLNRPSQNAVFNVAGGATLTSYQYTHQQVPKTWKNEIAGVVPYFKRKNPLVPSAVWPNAKVQTVAAGEIAGLFTGQKTVDQLLADLDAAFNQGKG